MHTVNARPTSVLGLKCRHALAALLEPKSAPSGRELGLFATKAQARLLKLSTLPLDGREAAVVREAVGDITEPEVSSDLLVRVVQKRGGPDLDEPGPRSHDLRLRARKLGAFAICGFECRDVLLKLRCAGDGFSKFVVVGDKFFADPHDVVSAPCKLAAELVAPERDKLVKFGVPKPGEE